MTGESIAEAKHHHAHQVHPTGLTKSSYSVVYPLVLEPLGFVPRCELGKALAQMSLNMGKTGFGCTFFGTVFLKGIERFWLLGCWSSFAKVGCDGNG